MSKVCVVFGAGSGLGTAMARRFGRAGYRIALVARTATTLETLARTLAADGIEASAFPVDLTDEAAITPLVARIGAELGPISAAYYAPTTNDAFLPAATLTPEEVRPFLQLWFFGMIQAFGAIVPQMRAQGGGAFLAAFGGNAAEGMAYLSGSGPAQAAARNYLYSLHGELAPEGIHVGMVSINGVIKGSGYHQALESGAIEMPEDIEMPVVDPDEMAQTLWTVATGSGALETFYPAQ